MEGQNGHVDATTAQKALRAMDLIAVGVRFDDAIRQVHVGHRAVEKVRGVLRRRPDLEPSLRDGSLMLDAAMREAGYLTKESQMRLGVAYGKGDKWREATEPLRRYLEAWQLRGMEFRHLNPREASKRLEKIAELEQLLTEARADLEQRAVRATTSAPRQDQRVRHDLGRE